MKTWEPDHEDTFGVNGTDEFHDASLSATRTGPNDGTPSEGATGAPLMALQQQEAETQVPLDLSLTPTPTGLAVGVEFRLLFLPSDKRSANENVIDPYNTFIQNLAAAGHADIRAYSSGFRVVGCTAHSTISYLFPQEFPQHLVRFKKESGQLGAELNRRQWTHPHTVRRWRYVGVRPGTKHIVALLEVSLSHPLAVRRGWRDRETGWPMGHPATPGVRPPCSLPTRRRRDVSSEKQGPFYRPAGPTKRTARHES